MGSSDDFIRGGNNLAVAVLDRYELWKYADIYNDI